ncbi:hypothetical protein AT4G20953 [Arabidopsis thaliana]|uniref:Uncharacterized protein n=1 Tax=Arabidopsis thaliana TaxID=3702 RepID=A0A1P8B6X4_ARATH|nr:uncharacterized protein AT4G20953 [Arabidopsis thaliana]ANM67336.1 hypothetical protein AT4G20953 [Arabidopsis thaliana]|eukprot:NP_001329170.1 hypothetical protein AT4G20953 [Arabidopsis thaliana]
MLVEEIILCNPSNSPKSRARSGSKTTTSIPGRASHSTSSFDIAACSPTRKGLQGTIDPIILGDDTSSRAVRTITLTDEEVPPIKEEHPITSINIPTSLSLTPNQEQEEKSSGGRHLENLDDDTPSSAARTITLREAKRKNQTALDVHNDATNQTPFAPSCKVKVTAPAGARRTEEKPNSPQQRNSHRHSKRRRSRSNAIPLKRRKRCHLA